MENLISLFFSYADFLGLFILMSILLFKYNHLKEGSKKWILIFYLIFFFSTSVTAYLSYKGFENIKIYNLLPFLLSIPLHFFFNKIHVGNLLKNANRVLFFFIILYGILNFPQLFKDKLMPTSYLIFSFIILINSVGYLNEELTLMRSENVFYKIEFWFASCLFFYATVCVIVWSLFSYLAENESAQTKFLHPTFLWIYGHNSVLFIQSLVFSISVLQVTNKK